MAKHLDSQTKGCGRVRPHRPRHPPKFWQRRPQSRKRRRNRKRMPISRSFRSEQREAKAKEMSKVKHRKLQCEQDFRAVRNYSKIHCQTPSWISINGADHQGYLLGRYQKENNYMSKKCGHKWNLMTSGASPHPYCQIR